MIFEVKCDERRTNGELADRTHTRIVSFIVLDIFIIFIHIVSEKFCAVWLARSSGTVPLTLAARVRL